MSDQFVVFAIPAFDNTIILPGVQSMLETAALLTKEEVGHAHILIGGDPYLPKVRNLCVARALRLYPMMTDFFFIDSDVSWPAEAALRLIRRPEEVVCGVYPKKNDVMEFPVFVSTLDEDKDGRKEFIVKDGLFKANCVPTGFLRIKRAVLERLAGVSGYYDDGTGGEKDVPNMFEARFRPFDTNGKRGDFWGEDYDWSRKWHELGGDMWVDPDINFGHMGKKLWQANFLEQGINAAIANGKGKMPGLVEVPKLEAAE